MVSEERSHSKDHETHTDPNNLKSSSNEEETKPLMAARCSGHGSINHGSSFVGSINSTEGLSVDANHILLVSHTHSHDS